MTRKINVLCLRTGAVIVVVAFIVIGFYFYNHQTGNTPRVRKLRQSIAAKRYDDFAVELDRLFPIAEEGPLYVNSGEQRHTSTLLLGVLEEWTESGFHDWTNVENEKSMIIGLLISCASVENLGRGIADTEKGLAIAHRAAQMFNNKYPRLGSSVEINRKEDGMVSFGLLTRVP